MAILHGLEPAPLELRTNWDGSMTWHCPECGTNGNAGHKPGGEECRLLADDRAAK